MTTERQRRLRDLFDAALEQPSGLRAEYLARTCKDDFELLRAVEKLLQANERAAGVLDTPVRQRVEAVTSPILLGSFIGPYKILSKLGGGGMGIVYQAVRADEVFQRVCAIKVIRPELYGGWLKERFRRESQILGRLDHLNIARIVDGGSTSEGLPYFVMDYVDGPPIDKFCAHYSLKPRNRIALFQQACSAVEYIHRNGVVHGDLKPSNILVGHDGVVKLVDFGIARTLADSDKSESIRNAPPALMTPRYASPEQLEGQRMTPVSDVYSLGVILYELLIADSQTPAAHQPIVEVPQSGPPGAAPANRSMDMKLLPSWLQSEFGSIVSQALHRDPLRRYPSAASLKEEISRFLENRPVKAYRSGPFYHGRKFFARHRHKVLAVPLFAVLVFALSWQGIELHKRYERALFLENEVRLLQVEILQNQAGHGQESIGSAALHQPGRLPNNGKVPVAELRDIGNLANAYHSNFAESVRLWPGMTPSRRNLLGQTDEYLRQAEPFVGGSPSAKEVLSYAWMQLANLEGNPETVNLHDRAAAASSIGEATRLLDASPQAPSQLVQQVQAAARQIASGEN